MTARHDSAEADSAAPMAMGVFGFDDAVDGWLERFRAAEERAILGEIGPYEVLSEVGRGGQGVVYQARRRGDDRLVALKRLAVGGWATADTRRRFAREIGAIAALSHPNIVSHVGMEVIDGHALLVMEWIEGVPITRWASGRKADGHESSSKGQRPIRDIVGVVIKTCDAVHHAHQRGILHRDLKPANILVDRSGEPHVLDFGLARLIDPVDGEPGTTHSRQFLGTPAYASPEQLAGSPASLDIRTDVYSLGVVLYELLTGRAPFDVRRGGAAGADAIHNGRAARPSSICGDVDRELDAIVLQAVAAEPDRRYPSVEALAADLRRYLSGAPVQAHPPSRWYELRKFIRRNRPLAGMAAATVMILIAATVLMGLQMRRTAHAREEERRARVVAERVSAFLGETLASPRASRRGANVKVMELLEDASRRAQTELADQPEVAAEVHYAIGTTYSSLWRWRDAHPHLEKALTLTRPRHDGDEQLARCLTALGTVQTSLRSPDAVPTQREALELRQRLHAGDHALVALSMTKLAYALHQAAAPPQWKEADALFDEALAMYRRMHGETHRDIGSCLHNYGWMRRRQWRFSESLAYYEDALRVFRALGDREDPYYLECMHGLASLLNLRGRYEQNLDMLEESIPITQRIYGGEGTQALWVERAQACLAMGRLTEADEAFREAFLLQCNIIEAAEPALCRETRAVWLSLLKTDSGTEGLPIAEMLDLGGRLTETRKRGWIGQLCQYSGLLIRRGETDRALTLLDHLRRMVEADATCSACRPDILEAQGDALLSARGFTASLAAYQEALRMLSDGAARGRWHLARVESKAGECLLNLGRIVEARRRVSESQNALRVDLGPWNVETIAGEARLARIATNQAPPGGSPVP